MWLKIVIVSGRMPENFKSLRWKVCLWHAFKVYESSAELWLRAIVKGITSDNKLINLCEIGLFHIVWGIYKLPAIIIMRFDENNVYVQNISIYMFRGGTWGTYMVHRTFFDYYSKNGKSTRTFFPRMNNKHFTKRGLQGALLLFLYEVSIVVLVDFIAILLAPGIFLIQIVNTNNTNMYLIHFHSKNIIKMRFPKVGF